MANEKPLGAMPATLFPRTWKDIIKVWWILLGNGVATVIVLYLALGIIQYLGKI